MFYIYSKNDIFMPKSGEFNLKPKFMNSYIL